MQLSLSYLYLLLSLTLFTAGTATSKTPVNINNRSAKEVVQKLNLTANVEKGYFKETFEDKYRIHCLNRSASTAIYYLLEGSAGDSAWHRVDAAEVWHYYAGAPLVLSLSYNDSRPLRKLTLGPDIFAGEQPQVVVGRSEWQSARSLGEWTLVGTTGMILFLAVFRRLDYPF